MSVFRNLGHSRGLTDRINHHARIKVTNKPNIYMNFFKRKLSARDTSNSTVSDAVALKQMRDTNKETKQTETILHTEQAESDEIKIALIAQLHGNNLKW